MILDIVLLAFVLALARGGNFRTLGSLQLKHLWLAFLAPVIVLLLAVARKTGYEPQVLQISGYLHIAVLVPWLILLWSNRKIAGTMLIAVGVIINILPIAFNGGKMPVSLPMARVANIGPQLERYITERPMERHSIMSGKTRFNWLADWIPIPRPPFYLGATVASPGDVIATLGMVLLITSAMGAPLRRIKNESKT